MCHSHVRALRPRFLDRSQVTREGGGLAGDVLTSRVEALVDLVDQARSGKKDAWEALIERLKGVVWRATADAGLTAADREDVFAATFFRLFEHLDGIREPEKLPGWLATTARNEVIQLLRQKRRSEPRSEIERREKSDMVDVDEGVLDGELRSALQSAFLRLGCPCQDLLRLVTAVPPLSYEQISALMGIPRHHRPHPAALFGTIAPQSRTGPFPPRRAAVSHPDFSSDDVLLAALSASLDNPDPVPAAAVQATASAWEICHADVELAALVADSSSGTALVLLREDADLRALTFVSSRLMIEIEIDSDRHGIGVISPSGTNVVEVETASDQGPAIPKTAPIDDLGRFRVDVGVGLCRLRIGSEPNAVVSSWFYC